jgi:bifunctional DNase/RNase
MLYLAVRSYSCEIRQTAEPCRFTLVPTRPSQSLVPSKTKHRPAPLTHDLFVNLLDEWDMTLERVVIHALRDNTFYALLSMVKGETRREIDARPSDAIAIALRVDAPIWVMEEVVADASIPVDRDADEAEKQAFQEFLSNISPSDFSQRGKSSTSNDS